MPHLFTLPFTNPVLIFCLILLIILCLPILMAKINMPGVVGLIIAGIAIGPHGTNLLQKSEAVDLFATIGLLYIMFLAGVELDMSEFAQKKHKSFVFGFLTFIIPICIGFPVLFYLLHYPLITAMLTASMFATHTLIAYPIVSKYGIVKNEVVAIAVGGTILTDTAVLIILAILTEAHQGTLNLSFWVHLMVSLAVFNLVIFLALPRIARWFFKYQKNEETTHFVFVLLMVFVAAFMAQVAGVEPIIGAFLAGLALNRLIPQTSVLLQQVNFVGNAIFIPFFLISVGMLVDLRVLFMGPQALIIAGSLTLVALLGKWLAALIVQRLFKYSGTQRKLLFGLSTGHAAATMAIILVGYKAKIIDAYILNGTILLILVTCMIASFATERATKQIVDENKMAVAA